MPYKDKEKQREYQRQWVAQRKEEYFADKCCAVCGSVDNLELDHIDPAEKVSHNIWTWSESRRLEELAKCQVLCKQHHKEKTNQDYLALVEHGTRTMYDNRLCRCDKCRAWRRAKDAKRQGNR